MLRSVRRGAVPTLCCLALALLATQPAHGAATAANTTTTKDSRAALWATQLQFDHDGVAWSTADFAAIKAKGIDEAELDMPWSTIEPTRGSFDFGELDLELAHAAAAGVKLVPIFWLSGWGGSPASWITDFEVTSGGATGSTPAWWDRDQQNAYFAYVTATIANIDHRAGYGGSILNYGRLDAQWSDNGVDGWAPADIAYFHTAWLPATYGTIARFNARNGTAFASFDDVPAAVPGAPLAGIYQDFRQWSVQDTYTRLAAAARKLTNTPLYFYFGGHIANAPDIGNLPDALFAPAREYGVTIIEDAAASPGLSLLFGSLARAYHVKVAQEWTPTTDDQMPAEAAQWMANYAMTEPFGGGEDFFIHDGTSKDVIGYPLYTAWLPVLKSISGSYPQQPVAVYFDYSQAWGNASGGSLNDIENEIAGIWDDYQAGFAVVTSTELANHADSLSNYRAVLPLNGVDANLTAYQQGGGTLLTSASQLSQYAPAYAELSNPHALQVVPATAADRRSATMTVAEVNPVFGFDGTVVLHPDGLNLRSGTYHVVDALTGTAIAQKPQADGGICTPVSMASATLDQWRVVPGAAPAGTPVPATCSLAGSGATSITGTAGQSGGDIEFLAVGATGQGSDANLAEVTQGGQTAYATWTSAQSGVGGAYVYLQLNPSSQVDAASTVTLSVTYWSVAGQGFQPQYDAPGNPYLGGPTVAGSGTGSWQTATVTLPGTQFGEAQNLSADLRLNVTDPTQPLYVSSVTMSIGD